MGFSQHTRTYWTQNILQVLQSSHHTYHQLDPTEGTTASTTSASSSTSAAMTVSTSAAMTVSTSTAMTVVVGLGSVMATTFQLIWFEAKLRITQPALGPFDMWDVASSLKNVLGFSHNFWFARHQFSVSVMKGRVIFILGNPSQHKETERFSEPNWDSAKLDQRERGNNDSLHFVYGWSFTCLRLTSEIKKRSQSHKTTAHHWGTIMIQHTLLYPKNPNPFL